MTPRILITGAGSAVGHAIAKALRLSTLEATIVFGDIDPFNPGFYRADEAIIIPRVENDGALETMIATIKEQKIDVVMIGSVFDLMFFAENKDAIEKETGTRVIVSPPETIRVATDKWLTVESLREKGLPFPRSSLAETVDKVADAAQVWGYPVIVKPRKGRGSHGVHLAADPDHLMKILAVVEEPLVQEVIATPASALGAEYTCSVVKLADGRLLGPFTARRSLRTGHSWTVEVGFFEEIHDLLLSIADAYPMYGSFNVQLMVGPDGPVPFEFNPRFSGTTAMRAHFGFNEPEAIVRHDLLGEKIPDPEIRKGMAFRYLEEVYVDDLGADQLGPPFPKGTVHNWF